MGPINFLNLESLYFNMNLVYRISPLLVLGTLALNGCAHLGKGNSNTNRELVLTEDIGIYTYFVWKDKATGECELDPVSNQEFVHELGGGAYTEWSHGIDDTDYASEERRLLEMCRESTSSLLHQLIETP